MFILQCNLRYEYIDMFLKGHFKIAKISKLLPPTLKTLAGDSLKFG